jgi:hypothetical protein
MEALCWWRNTMPELGTHSREALQHWPQTGFFSSHFNFRWRQVKLYMDMLERTRDEKG